MTRSASSRCRSSAGNRGRATSRRTSACRHGWQTGTSPRRRHGPHSPKRTTVGWRTSTTKTTGRTVSGKTTRVALPGYSGGYTGGRSIRRCCTAFSTARASGGGWTKWAGALWACLRRAWAGEGARGGVAVRRDADGGVWRRATGAVPGTVRTGPQATGGGREDAAVRDAPPIAAAIAVGVE